MSTGLIPLSAFWHFVAELLKTQHDEAARKARQQSAEESGRHCAADACECRACGCEVSSDQTYKEAGAVCDTLTDVARQHRNHEVERESADGLEPCRRGSNRTEIVAGLYACDSVYQERQRYEDTACDRERKHVGNAVHQVLVNLSAEALAAGGGSRRAAPALVMVDRSVAVHNAVYQLVRNLDTVGYLCRDDLLAAEPCHFNGLVCGYDDTVALLDLLGGEDILCAAGAVRLHLDGDTEPLSRLFERFRRHVGMRDTGWGRR